MQQASLKSNTQTLKTGNLWCATGKQRKAAVDCMALQSFSAVGGLCTALMRRVTAERQSIRIFCRTGSFAAEGMGNLQIIPVHEQRCVSLFD